MTDPTPDLITDDDVLAAYDDLPGWDAVHASGAVAPVAVAAVDQAVAVVAAESTLDELDPVPATRHRGRRRGLVAVGLVAAVTAAVVVLPSALHAPTASAEAASLLTHVADAIRATDPAAAPGQWWRIESSGTNLMGAAVADTTSGGGVTATWLVTSSRIEYAAVDGTRPSVFVDSPTRVVRKLAGPSDVTVPPLGPTTGTWTTGLAPADVPASWQQPSPTWLASLPLDPVALRDRLYADTAGHGRSVDGEAFVYVADLLRSGVVPADLRAALYRVLATVPGVEITSSRATIGDATGVGLGYDEAADGTRQEIVVDPTDGELVGERYVAVEALDGIPAGTVTGTTEWTRTLVDEIPAAVRAAVVDQNCSASADGGVACSPATK
ncbi:MAG TPA: CU044_5270 family protein [Candidatus Nanopelagicales bacterium]